MIVHATPNQRTSREGRVAYQGVGHEAVLHWSAGTNVPAVQPKRRKRRRPIRVWKRAAAAAREPSPTIAVNSVNLEVGQAFRVAGEPNLLLIAPGHAVVDPPANVQEYTKQLLALIEVKLKTQLATIDAADIDLATLGSVDEVADTMVSQLPASHPFDKTIGPFYDAIGAANRMHVSRDTVQARATNHEVLACPTAEGDEVFPTFQFNSDGTALPGLDRVLAALAAGTQDRWQVALWLTTPNEQLKGRTPSDALKEGASAAVQAVAEQTADRWCH